MSENVYSVYLVRSSGQGNRVRGGERQVTSPVEGTELDFYESGVWLTRETGRNFFPYEQIRTIREHPAGESGAESDGRTESEAEAATEGGGGDAVESGDAGESDEAAERDAGAEEDLVE